MLPTIIIPNMLKEQANSLIDYLACFPFQTPTVCKHCGSKNFIRSHFERNNRRNNIPYFFCRSCKRRFTQTTNSYFSGIGYLSLFAPFAQLRLAGHSQEQISRELGFALATARDRDKLLLKIMRAEYPDLYTWWKPHQDYQDKQLAPEIAQQQEFFIQWLKTTLHQGQTTCPYCRQITMSKANKLICSYCAYETVLFIEIKHHAKPYRKLLIPFVISFINGKSGHEMARELTISFRTASLWKRNVTKQMEAFNLNKLLQWTTWQQSRAVAYKAKLAREQNKIS